MASARKRYKPAAVRQAVSQSVLSTRVCVSCPTLRGIQPGRLSRRQAGSGCVWGKEEGRGGEGRGRGVRPFSHFCHSLTHATHTWSGHCLPLTSLAHTQGWMDGWKTDEFCLSVCVCGAGQCGPQPVLSVNQPTSTSTHSSTQPASHRTKCSQHPSASQSVSQSASTAPLSLPADGQTGRPSAGRIPLTSPHPSHQPDSQTARHTDISSHARTTTNTLMLIASATRTHEVSTRSLSLSRSRAYTPHTHTHSVSQSDSEPVSQSGQPCLTLSLDWLD